MIEPTAALAPAPDAHPSAAPNGARRGQRHDLPRELLAALVVAAVALAVDASFLWVLAERVGMPILLAASIAFITGAFVNWALSVRFVFRFRRYHSPAREFVAFVAIGLVALALNDGVIEGLTGALGFPLMLAKIGAAGATFCCNFGLRKALLFSEIRLAPVWSRRP